MRLLHTADWHLGRVFFGVSLLEDQAHVLAQLVEVVRREQPDLVIIAGDVFDRAVPPAEAVALFDDVLDTLVNVLDVAVALVSGNHDSPERVGFGARVLAHRRVYVGSRARDAAAPIALVDEHGPLELFLVPYVDPRSLEAVRSADGRDDASPRTPAGALAALVDDARRARRAPRAVIVAHGSVAGAAESDAERPIPGGVALDATAFRPFSYAALGHHHRAQSLDGDRVRYAGSPLAYSFAEVGRVPSVSVVDVGGEGGAVVREVPLAPVHPLAVVEGTLKELLEHPDPALAASYVKAILTDDGPVLEPMARLSVPYPHLLVVEQTRLTRTRSGDAAAARPLPLDDVELFAAFHREVSGRELSDEERAVLVALVRGGPASEPEAA